MRKSDFYYEHAYSSCMKLWNCGHFYTNFIIHWFAHRNCTLHIHHRIHTHQHAQTSSRTPASVVHMGFIFWSFYSLTLIISHLVLFSCMSTDVLLKSKVLLCFYSLYTGFTWIFNDLSIETRSLQQQWTSYKTNREY